MPWFNIFQDKSDIENVDFDIILNEFKELISEWKSNPKIFSSNIENTIENRATTSSFVMHSAQEINEEKINKTIKELKDSLKYQLFLFFWEKKEKLKLSSDLKEKIEKINSHIVKTSTEIQEIKSDNEKYLKDETSKDLYLENNTTFLKHIIIKNKEEATHIKNAKLKHEKIKSDFLTHINQTKKETIKEIEEINQKIKNLEIENENIIKNTIYKTETIYQLVLSFWTFRMKNNEEKYKFEKQKNIIVNENFKKSFSNFFVLKDIIVDNCIRNLIQNEKQIFNNIVEKYFNERDENSEEYEQLIKKQNEIKENIESINKKITEEKENIQLLSKNLNEQKHNLETLRELKEKIKEIKNYQLLENEIILLKNLINYQENENITKKEQLKIIDKKIKTLKSEVKNQENTISQKQDDNIRANTDLKINNKNLKKVEKEISLNENEKRKILLLYSKKNMKIKNDFFKSTSKYEKQISTFFKDLNKLESKKFIETIDKWWEVNENKNEILNLGTIFHNKDELNFEEKTKKLQKENQNILEKQENKINKVIVNYEKELEKAEKEIIKILQENTEEKLKILNPTIEISLPLKDSKNENEIQKLQEENQNISEKWKFKIKEISEKYEKELKNEKHVSEKLIEDLNKVGCLLTDAQEELINTDKKLKELKSKFEFADEAQEEVAILPLNM